MNVIIAGDFCPNGRLRDVEWNGVNVVSSPIINQLKNADISIVNLECPITANGQKAILKQGPNFSCDPSAISYLKNIGFTTVTLANNHIFDYGEVGLLQTISVIRKEGLDYVGAGKASDIKRKVLFYKTEEITIAIINCCESEFSVTAADETGANPLDPIEQFYMIKSAKEKADRVIVIVHGGIEHFQHPTMRMHDNYRFFVDVGADAVINHHQHCCCGYEVYKGKPIFYGLGNFCFDWEGKRSSIWNEGYLVNLSFEKNNVGFCIIPYMQCDNDPHVKLMDDLQSKSFFNRMAVLNRTLGDKGELERTLRSFMSQTESDYLLSLEPYSSRIGVGLYRRGLLPSFVNSKRILKLYDFIVCESHRERLSYLLKEKYKQL